MTAMNLIPPFLKPGDKVALVSPAGCIEKECLERGLHTLRSWGLECICGTHVLEKKGPWAGDDKVRRDDFQQALDNPEIKAIFCNRGGYGSARIIDQIDFSILRTHPKWIVGFSDITVFHSHLNRQVGIASLHAAMPQSFLDENHPHYPDSMLSLKNALFGPGNIRYDIPPHKLNRAGTVKAPIVGGNLSILYSLRGTASDLDVEGKILFIEDLGEYDYHLDRMLNNLERGGWFGKIAGLMVGSFTNMKTGANPMETNTEETIASFLQHSPHPFPVCFQTPCGHVSYNHALIMGAEAILDVNEKGCRLEFHL